MVRWIFLLALLAGNAAAQYSPAALEVLALAPQLEVFAGSKANFESLSSGLRTGKPVRVVTITSDGMREIVSFTAANAMSAEQTARVLENARYHLLESGLAGPSGWDGSLMRGITEGRLVSLADPVDSRLKARFTPPCALPRDEAKQVLLAAAERLAAQGIGEPVIAEVRAAVSSELATRCSAAGS